MAAHIKGNYKYKKIISAVARITVNIYEISINNSTLNPQKKEQKQKEERQHKSAHIYTHTHTHIYINCWSPVNKRNYFICNGKVFLCVLATLYPTPACTLNNSPANAKSTLARCLCLNLRPSPSPSPSPYAPLADNPLAGSARQSSHPSLAMSICLLNGDCQQRCQQQQRAAGAIHTHIHTHKHTRTHPHLHTLTYFIAV